MFGKELREKEFMFEKGYLNLNHGMSYALWLLLNPTKYHFYCSWCLQFTFFSHQKPSLV